MTFSKQIFSLFFLLFFPLRHASNPRNGSSNPIRCGPLEVPIRFPFCDHAGFNLHCNDLNKTVLELPMSGTFLVQDIDYINQQIYIKDPENCWPKRLSTFNISGSPFFHRYDMFYTLLACPNEVVSPSWYPSIRCLNTSTSTFFATNNSDLAKSMLPSCKIVEILHVRANSRFKEIGFSSYLNSRSLTLEWNSPNCKDCEVDNLRCGFKNKTSLEVECFDAKKPGTDSIGFLCCSSYFLMIQENSIYATDEEEVACFGWKISTPSNL
ncbi:unnamed protein product [Arabis nemorensis]|uniref:RING-type E3 ubiquitin transferase n=1 Tax=Arabis nemorensis TaxID=586526 RepID=A0A565BQ52_9BRAS|nr:unnamed protein product [Arabis nemorensis]